jgi:hypothetical protein
VTTKAGIEKLERDPTVSKSKLKMPKIGKATSIFNDERKIRRRGSPWREGGAWERRRGGGMQRTRYLMGVNLRVVWTEYQV